MTTEPVVTVPLKALATLTSWAGLHARWTLKRDPSAEQAMYELNRYIRKAYDDEQSRNAPDTTEAPSVPRDARAWKGGEA